MVWDLYWLHVMCAYMSCMWSCALYCADVSVCGSGINQGVSNADAAGGLSSSWQISARTSALGLALRNIEENGIGRLRHAVMLMARLWVEVYNFVFRASIVAGVRLSN